MAQAEAAEMSLQELGAAAKVRPILDLAIERGWLAKPESAKKYKNMFNSMYGALARNAERFVLISPGTWDLTERRKS